MPLLPPLAPPPLLAPEVAVTGMDCSLESSLPNRSAPGAVAVAAPVAATGVRARRGSTTPPTFAVALNGATVFPPNVLPLTGAAGAENGAMLPSPHCPWLPVEAKAAAPPPPPMASALRNVLLPLPPLACATGGIEVVWGGKPETCGGGG